MKQILQNLGSGETLLVDVPAPSASGTNVLIASQASVVSIGTERMLIEFGKASLLQKARQQPERVKDVINKVKTDGLAATMEAVKSKLDTPVPLGYCNAGIVLDVGPGVKELKPGDRVVSNGPHAEVVSVGENLCAKLPDNVSYEEGAFAVLGSIALQGVRLAQPTLGESFAVMGLGLIGLITAQLLRANGCRVIGFDFDPAKCALAEQFGVTAVHLSEGVDSVGTAMAFSRNRGVDGVIITAATKSDSPIHDAPNMCRKRGRVILTGVVGLNLKRDDFYKKEISFQVSCAYGPGRYEEEYESKGLDYPIGFVRWTAQRNFEAVLDMMSDGRIDVKPLITKQIPFEESVEVYGSISTGGMLGIVLQYPAAHPDLLVRSVPLSTATAAPIAGQPAVAVIGAGNFTAGVLLPALAPAGLNLHTIVSASGVGSAHLGKKFGFKTSSSDAKAVLADPSVDAVFVTTRPNSHARYVIEALKAEKRVFVEKPICVTREELQEIEEAYSAAKAPFVMCGFNRRFSPFVQRLKRAMDSQNGTKSMIMTVNAGALPPDHWTHDRAQGGRIIGEGIHFVDLLRFLAGSPIKKVSARATTDSSGTPREDEATIVLEFADGSTGTLLYLANGSKAFPKERLEVFAGGRIAQINNFRNLEVYDWPGLSPFKTKRQEKGHVEEIRATVDAMKGGKPSPIPFSEIVEVARATFDAVDQLRS